MGFAAKRLFSLCSGVGERSQLGNHAGNQSEVSDLASDDRDHPTLQLDASVAVRLKEPRARVWAAVSNLHRLGEARAVTDRREVKRLCPGRRSLQGLGSNRVPTHSGAFVLRVR